MSDFSRDGPGPIDWLSILSRAQKMMRGDPVTGEFYALDNGRYCSVSGGGKIKECGNQIAIAFDAATNQVLKHGKPEEVERYAINARKAYSQREDDIYKLVPTLIVVWMPPLFDVDKINRVLRNPRFLMELIGKASEVKLLREQVRFGRAKWEKIDGESILKNVKKLSE